MFLVYMAHVETVRSDFSKMTYLLLLLFELPPPGKKKIMDS